jgi:hypothetical protein
MPIQRNLLIAVLILSGGSAVWFVLFGEKISLKDFIMAIPVLLSVLGLNQARADRPPEPTTASGEATPAAMAAPFRLTPSFESGLYGGLIGGTLAGGLIGVAYYLASSAAQERPGLGMIPQIVVYAALVGAVVGACSQLSILWFRYATVELRYPAFLVNEVSGGMLGGVVGGILVGALGGWYFVELEERDLPVIEPELLVGGTLFGAIFIALGALLYDYHGRGQNVVRAVLISIIITPLLAGLVLATMHALGIGIVEPFGQSGAAGGAILGGIIGLIMGLQIGLTLRLYRGWAALTEPMAR